MCDMTTIDKAISNKQVRITIHRQQAIATRVLQEGESALVGNGVGCHLQIDDCLAPHQCLVELKDGDLILHNWSEDNSTYVNGTAIQEGVKLNLNDRVSFWNYRIFFEFDHCDDGILPTDQTDEHVDVDEPDPVKIASVEESTVAILHSEIEFLQSELQQRDQQIKELQTNSGPPTQPTESPALTQRVDDLLGELELADAQRSNLMDEIRSIEELREAENEERSQLTVWVNQIEDLVAKREDELKAEMECLSQKLELEREHRLQEQARADDNATGTESAKETLAQLRQDHENLREKLDETKSLAAKLGRECLALREQNSEAEIEKCVHDALRQERLQLAQERATVSRREHELVKKLKEAEFILETAEKQNVAEACVSDIRQTINEIDAPKVSISQRLVEIWDRLDGPTDRD